MAESQQAVVVEGDAAEAVGTEAGTDWQPSSSESDPPTSNDMYNICNCNGSILIH